MCDLWGKGKVQSLWVRKDAKSYLGSLRGGEVCGWCGEGRCVPGECRAVPAQWSEGCSSLLQKEEGSCQGHLYISEGCKDRWDETSYVGVGSRLMLFLQTIGIRMLMSFCGQVEGKVF